MKIPSIMPLGIFLVYNVLHLPHHNTGPPLPGLDINRYNTALINCMDRTVLYICALVMCFLNAKLLVLK